MKLLESYSRSTSVDLKHKPYLYEKYFPFPSDVTKYITLQNSSGMPAKNYSYYQEVVDILFPILEENKIKIVLLGDKDSGQLSKVLDFRGHTNIGQAAYLIKRALLHIGNDSWMCHYAAAEEIPLVSLYGSTTIDNHSPYHINKDKAILLESNRNGNKASFQREENPKTIDLINPEDICKAICKLLNIKFDYLFKTLSLGKVYHSKIIESAMDSIVNINALGIPNIICRLDYSPILNIPILIEQMKLGKVSIVTDKILPLSLLQQFRGQIIDIIYEIKENHNPNFCKDLQQLKIPYRLFTKLSDEVLNPIKLNYLDYNIISRLEKKVPDILKNKDISKIYIRGAKFIIGAKGLFNSYWAYKNHTTIPNIDAPPQQLIDKNLDDLGIDADYLYFLEKA